MTSRFVVLALETLVRLYSGTQASGHDRHHCPGWTIHGGGLGDPLGVAHPGQPLCASGVAPVRCVGAAVGCRTPGIPLPMPALGAWAAPDGVLLSWDEGYGAQLVRGNPGRPVAGGRRRRLHGAAAMPRSMV